MNSEIRLILFVQVYSIYFKITEESPSKILTIYNMYFQKSKECLLEKHEESERMKDFILYGRIGEKDDS